MLTAWSPCVPPAALISPITFLISLFTSEVNVYEVQNNGNWYDFGFMLGVALAFGGGAGGSSASAGRVRRRRRASLASQIMDLTVGRKALVRCAGSGHAR